MKSNPCVNCKEHCCIGEYGTFATLHDIKRIAEFTGKNSEEFAKYDDICDDHEGQKELMEDKDHSYFEYCDNGKILQLKSKDDGECIFLKDRKCEVYPARPLICKIFPIGFRKRASRIKIIIEPEDRYCLVTKKNSLNHILDFLSFTNAEATTLIRQFLDEAEIFKKKIPDLENKKLNDVIKEL